MRMRDWSSDVCSSDLGHFQGGGEGVDAPRPRAHRRRNGARTVSGNDALARAALRAEAVQWFNLERSGDMTVDDELRFLEWLDRSDTPRDAYRPIGRASGRERGVSDRLISGGPHNI